MKEFIILFFLAYIIWVYAMYLVTMDEEGSFFIHTLKALVLTVPVAIIYYLIFKEVIFFENDLKKTSK